LARDALGWGITKPQKTPPPVGAAATREILHDRRTELVRDMLAKESAAADAKTAKLRALRLAKEAEAAAANAARDKTPKPKRS
jgi:hypothetical protein